MTKVILYIATSQDGFIASKDGGVDWLPQPTGDADDMGYQALMDRISIIVMGSRSYDQILGFGEWAWSDKTTYVFTSQDRVLPQEGIHFTNEDVHTFIHGLKTEIAGKDIWLLGGAELIKSFAQQNLIDECIITEIPIAIGEGIALELPYDHFSLINTKNSFDGIIQRVYIKNKSI